MMVGLIFRVKLKKLDSLRERLVGINVDNVIGQYQYHHGLDDIFEKLINEKNVRIHSGVSRLGIADIYINLIF